ncbi:hypothetical protein AB0C10_37450 [Microbispora amethystogenes]|uniref:hypothetical protein n=1 Tax=Microbispora amethystogenes TaxID=1427754 RepID=UPI0033EB7ABE
MLTAPNAQFPHATALCRLFDADGCLLYVGLAAEPAQLDQEHQGKAWWPQVESVEVEWFENRWIAAGEEMRAIRREVPIYNGQERGHRRRRSTSYPRTPIFPRERLYWVGGV